MVDLEICQTVSPWPGVAQWIEHQSSELGVGGSNPSARAISPLSVPGTFLTRCSRGSGLALGARN